MTIVGPCIDWVPLLTKVGLVTEVLGVVLGAMPILVGILLHAKGLDMVWGTTGTMEHVLGDTAVEVGMEIRIWDLSRDQGIDMSSIMNFVGALEEDEEVHVRETTLLEFNGVDTASNFPKQSSFDLSQQGLLLELKDMCHHIRMISSSLG